MPRIRFATAVLAGRRGPSVLRPGAAEALHGRPGHARGPRQLLRRRRDENQRVRRRARSSARPTDAAANAAANHDRSDVRAVPDSAAAVRPGLARHHGARLDAHRRRARVDARRPRGLVSVFRAQRRGDLRRRSIGPRALGVRSVGAERSRSAAARRQSRRRRRGCYRRCNASPTTARIRPGSATCCRPARRSRRAG